MRTRSVFISYRREDSIADAARLSDRLSKRFDVFMDIDTIQPGEDFAERIAREVGKCDALVAVIGKNWLTITDENGRRRLDDPDDFVRLEIVAALERNIKVVPVLVQDATMPRKEDLPDALKPLAMRHALELNHLYWDYQVGRLIKSLRGSRWWADPRTWVAAAALVAVIAIAAIAARRDNGDDGTTTGNGKEETNQKNNEDDALSRTRIAFLSDRGASCNVWVAPYGGGERVELTNESGQVLRPDWSPDGTKIAYSANRGDGYNIHVFDVETQQEVQVIDAGGDEKGPDWSPDGSQVAFNRIDAAGVSEIFVAPTSGEGDPVQLTFDGARAIVPDWSPDGDTIAYSSDVGGDVDIYSIPAAGGEPTPLTDGLFPDDGSDEFGPAWSPDGKHLAFEATPRGDFDIFVMPAGSGRPRNVTSDSARDRYVSWSPDGTKLIFSSDRDVPPNDDQVGCAADERQADLFAVDADGGGAEPWVENTDSDESAPAWEPRER